MDALHAPERLHLGGVEGTVQIDPPLARLKLAIEGRRGNAQISHQQDKAGADVLQLIRRDADMIELLGDGQRDAVAVVQRPATRRLNRAHGALPLRLLGPSLPLNDLHLCRATEHGRHRHGEAELEKDDAGGRLGHQGFSGPAGRPRA